jgi:DNA-binding transcriptional regulator YiaG
MTSRESYIFGWVYGRIYVARGYDKDAADQLAAMRPYSANAKAITAASREGLLKGDLDMEIMEALNQIHSIDPPVEGGSEKVQPLEIQSSWQLGYYKALKGESLPPAELDVKAMRVAKGMTQAQLAQAIGTDQAVISRWEKGTAKPNEESTKKLMEALK